MPVITQAQLVVGECYKHPGTEKIYRYVRTAGGTPYFTCEGDTAPLEGWTALIPLMKTQIGG
jgi:hypothetical protein